MTIDNNSRNAMRIAGKTLVGVAAIPLLTIAVAAFIAANQLFFRQHHADPTLLQKFMDRHRIAILMTGIGFSGIGALGCFLVDKSFEPKKKNDNGPDSQELQKI